VMMHEEAVMNRNWNKRAMIGWSSQFHDTFILSFFPLILPLYAINLRLLHRYRIKAISPSNLPNCTIKSHNPVIKVSKQAIESTPEIQTSKRRDGVLSQRPSARTEQSNFIHA
jgi:hypothetical protein